MLTQKLEKIVKEREQDSARRETEFFELQQKSGLRSMYLEKKIATMKQELEKREAQVAEILIASNMEPAEATKVLYFSCIRLQTVFANFIDQCKVGLCA